MHIIADPCPPDGQCLAIQRSYHELITQLVHASFARRYRSNCVYHQVRRQTVCHVSRRSMCIEASSSQILIEASLLSDMVVQRTRSSSDACQNAPAKRACCGRPIIGPPEVVTSGIAEFLIISQKSEV